jgi:hypothetical protein
VTAAQHQDWRDRFRDDEDLDRDDGADDRAQRNGDGRHRQHGADDDRDDGRHDDDHRENDADDGSRDFDIRKLADDILDREDARELARKMRAERDADDGPANPEADLSVLWDDLDATGPVEPTICKRADGQGLFYVGHSNAIFGMAGSGKTWLELLDVFQGIAAGEESTFYDFEEPNPARSLSKLKAMVAASDDVTADDMIKLLHYKCVRRPLNAADLAEASRSSRVIIEGVGKALKCYGLKSDDDGVNELDNRLVVPFTSQGITTIASDHMPKAKDNQESAFGSVYKTNNASGSVVKIVMKEKMGLGRTGWSEIYITEKDRGGQLARAADDSGMVAVLTVDNTLLMSTTVTLTPTCVQRDAMHDVKIRQLAEEASRKLEAAPDGIMKNTLKTSLGGAADAQEAVDYLIGQPGYVKVVVFQRGRGGGRGRDGKRVPPQKLYSSEPYRVPEPAPGRPF